MWHVEPVSWPNPRHSSIAAFQHVTSCRALPSFLKPQLLESLAGAGKSTAGVFSTNPRVPGSFVIRHFAGAVQYDTNGLLDKNKDALSAGGSESANRTF